MIRPRRIRIFSKRMSAAANHGSAAMAGNDKALRRGTLKGFVVAVAAGVAVAATIKSAAATT